MKLLPFQQCGHLHEACEWSPTVDESGVRSPHVEEMEHSASLCFTVVAAASHWALDKGFAVLRIQRFPPTQTSNDWRGLLKLPPQSFRADSMAMMATHVGLCPCAGGSTRVQVQDVWHRGEALPADAVYISHSHFSHRLPVTCWENPFLAGRDGSAELAVYKYMLWFPRSGLHGCESHLNGYDGWVANSCRGCPSHQQSSVVAAAQSMLQGSERLSLKWPYIEDLVNSPHFAAFGSWLRERDLPDAGVLGPRALGSDCVMAQRASAAEESAVASKRNALPPVCHTGKQQTAISNMPCASSRLGILWIGKQLWITMCSLQQPAW
eukprot:s3508_g12.t2